MECEHCGHMATHYYYMDEFPYCNTCGDFNLVLCEHHATLMYPNAIPIEGPLFDAEEIVLPDLGVRA